VGKTAANKLSNDGAERWFDLIGDFPTASLLRLYSQVMFWSSAYMVEFLTN
jgi:hypothetical protein